MNYAADGPACYPGKASLCIIPSKDCATLGPIMADEPNSSGPGAATTPADRLDSWKEIAAYLKRDIRTVQRWEKYEGLPAHRHQHNKKPSVYAYKRELDAWFCERQPVDDPAADAVFVPEPDSEEKNYDAKAPAYSLEELLAKHAKQFALVMAALLVLAAVYQAYRYFHTVPAIAGKIRLAVLPFSNLNVDPAYDFFSAGFTDQLITQLGSLNPERLGVIAPTPPKLLAGKTVQEISLILNVQYIVEGSVLREGNQARIDVQLIEAREGTHLWTQSYTRDVSDILRMQAEVSSDVARQIGVTLPSGSSTVQTLTPVLPRAVNPEALDYYLKGSFQWGSRRDLPGSIQFFQLAIQRDPNYALAYQGLASAYLLLGQVPNDGLPPVEAKPKSRDAAQRALALDPNLGMAHAVLGNIACGFDWDMRAAEQEFRRAIQVEPNNATVHEWFGHYLIVAGRSQDASAEINHALELDPISPLFKTVRAEASYYARQYDQAIQQARSVLEETPDFWLARFWLGSAYREKGKYAEAVEQFRRARRDSSDNPGMIMAYGHAQGLAGNKAEARRALEELTKLEQHRYIPALYFAGIYLSLGEHDTAMAALEKAYEQKTDRLIYLGVDPIADPLRNDPRFSNLLRRIGLPE